MKHKTVTQSMSWLHTWCGLLLGWVLFAIFLTGTLAVFDKEISWWMQPELTDQSQSPAAAANVAQRWLMEHHADESNWNISLPTERSPDLGVSVGERRRGAGGTQLDPLTGEPIEARETIGGNFFFHFHYTLHMPRLLGIWVVGFAAMAMLVALISGIVIHKKIFKEFFTFRPAKGQRSWLDGHNASAVLLLPFHLMITYTGLVIFFLIYMPAAVDALYDGDRQAYFREAQPARAAEAPRGEGRGSKPVQAPAAPMLALDEIVSRAEAHYGAGMIGGLAVSNPGRANAQVTARPVLGNRMELTKGEGMVFNGVTGELIQAPEPSRASQLTQRVMAGLHFAQFGGYPMRWLYFICGLVSCAMIATGLVLYAVKQRKQAKANVQFLRMVESLNVAVVAGLSLACVALLWSNRLLPAELANRQDWELRLFFSIWALSWLHAWVRKPLQAWREQLFAAAALAMTLPLLDLMTANMELDGIRLSVLAAVFAMGLLSGWTAWKIPTIVAARKARQPQLARPVPGVSS
ncbi:PepSY domain-containing protein [Pseudomonas sp. MTM4]|uniref:PepSY-associated TM helix domain-containing protein n=1 Tax=unclassified Pseudomonas TaxID=196821 RepID=UPI0018D20753|nr:MULTISPECIES: PepSY-associated TM helix domain-containing protein [unclassified Pseudomonas]MBC8650176.1 PepSY domain-containing protein [Pseudomonas sp. MT4]QXY93784.1 PepSY domain-containing protein [Pseudomonas sp. MTM4]